MMMMITHYIIAKHSHAYIQQTDAKRGASKRERERKRKNQENQTDTGHEKKETPATARQ